jgi:hypothetical protein
MTVRGTLGLLLVLAALGLVLLVDRPQAPTPAELPPLLDVPVARVTRLEVRWPEVALTAERRDGAWRDRGGRVLPSDTVETFLATLAELRPLDLLSRRDAEHAAFGFAERVTSIAVFAGETPVLRLEVGARNPSWTGVYVRVRDASEVVLVGSLLHWELEKLRSAASR